MGKHKKREKKSKKQKRPASSSSSSDSSSDSDYKKHKKHKKHHKIKKKARKDKVLKISEETEKSTIKPSDSPESDNDYTVPLTLAESKRPETKEEYDKRQSIVRRVLDPETGRSRLIKGDGEIIEEIVSRDRHLEINKKATQTDGLVFQLNTVNKK